MSQAASSYDARTAPSSSHTSPKDGSRRAHALPPISTGREPTPNDQLLKSAHRITTEERKTEPASPAGQSCEGSARSLRMHSILNHPDPGQERRTSLPLPNSPRTQPGTARTLPSVNTISSPFTSGPHPGESKDAARPNYPPPLNTLPSRSPYETATHTPLLGTPNNPRPPYGFQGASAPGSERRGSGSVITAPQSQTTSPTTSYSSFVPTQRNSPAGVYATGPATAPLPNHLGPPGTQGPALVLSGEAPRRGNSTSNNSYQLMTLTTDQGSIQVPVDVQAASKVADEKRKRNAGASARFRQRRKEKERESSQTISRLETKVRDITEEKEYYRMERDYFRDLVYNSGVSAHVTPRLPSPKHRKASVATNGGNSEAAEWQQNGERGSDDGRNQRRRISGYNEGPPPSTTASYPGPPPPATHAPGYSQPPPPPQYSYSRPEARAAGPPQLPSAPIPMINGHYAPHTPTYNQAWKPQVS